MKKSKSFKLTIKAPTVRVVGGLLSKSGRVFRSGKVYSRKAGKAVSQ